MDPHNYSEFHVEVIDAFGLFPILLNRHSLDPSDQVT